MTGHPTGESDMRQTSYCYEFYVILIILILDLIIITPSINYNVNHAIHHEKINITISFGLPVSNLIAYHVGNKKMWVTFCSN